MKRAITKQPRISEEELPINEFFTMDTFGPHAKLMAGELRNLINMDLYGRYMITRRGSEQLSTNASPDYNILNYVIFDAGAKEFIVIQVDVSTESWFYSFWLDSTGTWKRVVVKSTGSDLVMSGVLVSDMMMSNGKIYVFNSATNYVFEYNSANEEFESRKMGLPAPQIVSVLPSYAPVPGEGLLGKRVYGVELVYKNTSVSPNVDVVVSGPNRALYLASPEFGEGALAIKEGTDIRNTIKVSPTLNDGTAIDAAENDNWTHARLWRSKDVTTATNTSADQGGSSEITGRFDELYQVQEMTRAAFLATLSGGYYYFAPDDVLDDEIPYPNDVVTFDRLELYPIPPASTGAFHRNRVWASGITSFPGPSGGLELENIESKIFYSPETHTVYSESVKAISAVESDPGDGQNMVKLIPFRDDLVGIKEGKTGIVSNGDPDAGWNTEDHSIGIENKKFAQFVPGVGICAIVNDQKDFRIFGYDQVWRNTFAGLNVSRPIRNIIKDWTADDISFMYMNGKLFLNGGEAEILVLAAEEKKGWSRYQYPMDSKSECMFTYDEGRKAAIVNGGGHVVRIEVDDLETDFNTNTQLDEDIDWTVLTHKWQVDGGRSIIEHRFLSIVAILNNNIWVQPYVNGRSWGEAFSMLLDPNDYPYDNLNETEYQGYAEIKPIGNYLHFSIAGTGSATIYSMMLNCLIQRGSIAPGFDPFEVLNGVERVPPWATSYLLFLKFYRDRDTAEDFSDNRADFGWSDGSGGSRTYDSNLVPGGGQNLAKGGGSGYSIVTAANLTISDKGIGQGSGGLCSLSLSFIIADTFPDVSVAEAVIDEDGDGVNYYRMKVLADGSIEFQWASATYDYSFTTTAGLVSQGSAAQYATLSQMIIFVLSNNGLNGQFYHGLITDTAISAITTTRTAN